MNLTLINVSTVFAGQGYQPAIFTVDYLRSTKVVKKEWELIQQPIANQNISVSIYSNGISIIIERARVQVINAQPGNDNSVSLVVEVAEALLRRIANVKHTAVGFNIAALIESDNAVEYIRRKFIKEEFISVGQVNEVGLVFAFPRNDAVLNLNFGSGGVEIVGEPNPRNGIMITANYHSDISTIPTLDASARVAKQQIERAEEHYKDFLALMPRIFDLEDTKNDTTE